MNSTIAIAIDGVLRHHVDSAPIAEGIRLYHALTPVFDVVLLADSHGARYEATIDAFLDREQLHEHGRVLYADPNTDDLATVRVLQASGLRLGCAALDCVLEANPVCSAELLAYGFHVLHFLHAQHTRRDWRPDYGRGSTSWETLIGKHGAPQAGHRAPASPASAVPSAPPRRGTHPAGPGSAVG